VWTCDTLNRLLQCNREADDSRIIGGCRDLAGAKGQSDTPIGFALMAEPPCGRSFPREFAWTAGGRVIFYQVIDKLRDHAAACGVLTDESAPMLPDVYRPGA
jgi:hypothetical protein